jgi:Na+-transporting NADH:ubiquinone oxidoreductase subunit NqrB
VQVLAFKGPLAIAIQVLAFALVVGALAMIVHALRRSSERWRFAWTRWVWVLLGSAFVLSLVFALIWPTDLTYTIVGFAFLVVLVTEVAYLLRVVFPSPARRAEMPPAAEPEPLDATVVSEPSAPEEPLDVDL